MKQLCFRWDRERQRQSLRSLTLSIRKLYQRQPKEDGVPTSELAKLKARKLHFGVEWLAGFGRNGGVFRVGGRDGGMFKH